MAITTADIAKHMDIMLAGMPTVNVVYTQGENEITLPAVLGRTSLTTADSEGVLVIVDTTDFIFRASDLQNLTPERDDFIMHLGVMYSVIQPIFRRSDPYGQTLRVFTKAVTKPEDQVFDPEGVGILDMSGNIVHV